MTNLSRKPKACFRNGLMEPLHVSTTPAGVVDTCNGSINPLRKHAFGLRLKFVISRNERLWNDRLWLVCELK